MRRSDAATHSTLPDTRTLRAAATLAGCEVRSLKRYLQGRPIRTEALLRSIAEALHSIGLGHLARVDSPAEGKVSA